MNGLSQQDRIERIRNTKCFDVMDNTMESLLYQIEAIAGFIRYHNLKGQPDGYFDRFLNELSRMREQGMTDFKPDGNMEPAQALLYAFLQQFHNITEQFNRKWDDFIYRYLMDWLGVMPLVHDSHKVCLGFTKNTTGTVFLNKGTKFVPDGDFPNVPAYLLCDDTVVENATVEQVFSIHRNEQRIDFQGAGYDIVTSLEVKNLSATMPDDDAMFCENTSLEQITPLGFIIASPSFILREGKRKVTMTFTSDPLLTSGTVFATAPPPPDNSAISYEETGIIKKLFHVWISVAEGWKQVSKDNYSVNRENGNHIFVFTLSDDFPETATCVPEVHEIGTDNPAVRIHLNYDACLDNHHLLKYLRFSQVKIKTCTEGIKNVLVYNDLGKLDCSKPFAPFGIQAEKDDWFVTGNYEAARKNTDKITLHIEWNSLPDNPTGMKGHYKGYNVPIDNTSFRVKAAYLIDNRWEETGVFNLFGKTEIGLLQKKSVIENASVTNMPPIAIPEEDYDYSIRSKCGFVKFTLVSPEIGFGEKRYRNIYSGFFINQALTKKKPAPFVPPNEPCKPVIERISLSYDSEETVDFRKYAATSSLAFYHITPFGYKQVFPETKNPCVTAFFSIDAKANLLAGLRNVTQGSVLTLYFDFLPLRKKITLNELPCVKWSLGNGCEWSAIPDGNILLDKTKNLMQSGIMKFLIPNDLDDMLFNDAGLIWLRAGIEKNAHAIPCLKKLSVNVAEAIADTEAKELYDRRSLAGAGWKAERQIPGLEGITTVETYHGKKRENREMCLMRVSEYATHRGKAVSPRDYERTALQEFPHIAKVKCLPAQYSKTGEKGVVTLVIIPRAALKSKNAGLLATSRQILQVEAFFKHHTSAYVNRIHVINPLYEEVKVRCQVTFRRNLSPVYCRSLLANCLDRLIAPWFFKQELPRFDSNLNMTSIHTHVMNQEYVVEINHLSFVVISKREDRAVCRLHEYGKGKNSIRPSEPYAIFVPAGEHLINTGLSDTFGISEMAVGDSFILS